MKWKKFTLKTTTEAVDLYQQSCWMRSVSRALRSRTMCRLTEEETKGMFIDILPELPPDEGVAKVSFYLED